MNRSRKRFIFEVIYFSTRVSNVFTFIGKIIMFAGGTVFDLYSADSFDKIVILFNSRIFV